MPVGRFEEGVLPRPQVVVVAPARARLESIGIDWNRFKSIGIDLNRLESIGIDWNRLESIWTAAGCTTRTRSRGRQADPNEPGSGWRWGQSVGQWVGAGAGMVDAF